MRSIGSDAVAAAAAPAMDDDSGRGGVAGRSPCTLRWLRSAMRRLDDRCRRPGLVLFGDSESVCEEAETSGGAGFCVGARMLLLLLLLLLLLSAAIALWRALTHCLNSSRFCASKTYVRPVLESRLMRHCPWLSAVALAPLRGILPLSSIDCVLPEK